MSFDVDEDSCLRELRGLLLGSEDPLLNGAVEDELFLRIFIIGRKYNVKHAFETIKGYMKVRYVKYREIFQIPVQSVRHVLESGFLGALRHRDQQGRLIGFLRFAKIDLRTMEYMQVIRTIILLAEAGWGRLDDVKNGQVFLADFAGYNLSIMTRYTLSEKLTLINIFWHNYPAKIKGLHAVNIPKLFTYAYSLIRPFFPEKIKKRIRLHGRDSLTFHQYVSPEILPVWLGGKLSDEEAIDYDLVRKILKD